VHTGISTREELAAHQPDVVLPNLGELRVEFLLHTP
jgi:phosphoglycolate phosphatase-like HAD superfamily hydrolase